MAIQKHLQKLDGIRGFAAVYVVIYHLIHDLNFVPGIIKRVFFSFGQEAVIIFFLLSGFVICLSFNQNPQMTFRSYFIKRFRRIYFPFLIAILVSITVAFWDGFLVEKFRWQQLVGNLLMLQDFSSVKPGVWFSTFLANNPLWSLSYEWWFYMLFFPLYKLLPKTHYRIYFVALISTCAFINYNLIPNQIALFLTYFIIWWCGLESAESWLKQGKFTAQNMKPIFLTLLFMLMLTLVPVFTSKHIQLGYYPFLTFRHFSAAFLALIVGLIWYQNKLIHFEQVLGIFFPIASISYGLYILHYPILKYLILTPYINNFWLNYGIKFLLIFTLAYLTEIKLQPLVNKWLKP